MVYSVVFGSEGGFETIKTYCRNDAFQPTADFYVGKYLAIVPAENENEAIEKAAVVLREKYDGRVFYIKQEDR